MPVGAVLVFSGPGGLLSVPVSMGLRMRLSVRVVRLEALLRARRWIWLPQGIVPRLLRLAAVTSYI